MKSEDKGQLYDDYIRQGDVLQREISKIKSEYPVNIPEDKQKVINVNQHKINILESKLMNLFK
jgi:hypothetical protein